MTAPERRSPLLELHRELGAKLTEFGGWDMPLQYEGIVAEHNAVRGSCGIFDVSHLGKLRLRGAANVEALQRAVTCDVTGLEVGSATYALVLNDDAGCIDDIFVYKITDTEALAVPNASNVAAVAAAIEGSGGHPVDEWDRWAILALQCPGSNAMFESVFPGSAAPELKLHRWTEIDLAGGTGMVARTGYTGERGFELYVPAEVAADVFRRFLDVGVTPVGLGARDTLRLEMGYALYGHELTLETDPLEAGLGWAIAWDAPFRGKEALERVKERGPARKLFGVRLSDRGVPRQGYPVLRGDERVGEVVSGNFSPTLGVGIALAYGDAAALPRAGEVVAIEARGRRMKGDIVKPPFIQKQRSG
ncbi:MAG TPA: glycine cleavage system aminomethyltransferase GcvT [Actinomycetota bacterium]|nr:glycine cleavage system aminomethyltransferase GcvT [Actinomycetota bacterium]